RQRGGRSNCHRSGEGVRRSTKRTHASCRLKRSRASGKIKVIRASRRSHRSSLEGKGAGARLKRASRAAKIVGSRARRSKSRRDNGRSQSLIRQRIGRGLTYQRVGRIGEGQRAIDSGAIREGESCRGRGARALKYDNFCVIGAIHHLKYARHSLRRVCGDDEVIVKKSPTYVRSIKLNRIRAGWGADLQRGTGLRNVRGLCHGRRKRGVG